MLKGGSNSSCSGFATGFKCIGGSQTSSSECSAICGDGIVILGKEKCDDKAKGGCLPDCSGGVTGYNCTGGDLTHATVCVLKSVQTYQAAQQASI